MMEVMCPLTSIDYYIIYVISLQVQISSDIL